MSGKENRHEEYLGKHFKFMEEIRDRRRGIPRSLLGDHMMARKAAEKAIIQGNPDIRKAIEEAKNIKKKAQSGIDNKKPLFFSGNYGRPGIDDRYRMGYIAEQFLCPESNQPRNFSLPFHSASTFGAFSDVPIPEDVAAGQFGWQWGLTGMPRLINNGSSGEKDMFGHMRFDWRGTVPYSGIYALNPSQMTPYVSLRGVSFIDGSGWLHDTDAIVEVEVFVFLFVGAELISWVDRLVVNNATGFDTKANLLDIDVDLPGRRLFQASEGQSLGMIIQLSADTWVSSDGYADVQIHRFGMPFNYMPELTMSVTD